MIPLTKSEIDILLARTAVQQYLKKRFYDWAKERAGGKRLNWPELSKEIKYRTGKLIPTNTLRVQYEPENRKKGKPPRQGFKNKQCWYTLFEFLICDAINFVQITELLNLDEPIGPFAELLNRFGNQHIDAKPYHGRFNNLLNTEITSDDEIVLDIIKTNSKGIAKAIYQINTDIISGSATSSPIWKGIFINLGVVAFILLRRAADKSVKIIIIHATSSASEQINHLALLVSDNNLGGLLASAFNMSFAENDEVQIGFKYKLMNKPMPLYLTREDINSMPKKTKRGFTGNKAIHELMKANSMNEDHSSEEQLIHCLLNGDFQVAMELIPKVKNINFINKEIGKAALHIAAVDSMPQILQCLWQRKDIDILLPDSDGRLASDLAWLEAGNQTLGMEISDREVAEKLRRKHSDNPEPN